MDEIEVTNDALAGLVTKLRSLELTDAESAALGTMLLAASKHAEDVSGYGVVFEVETFKGTDEELQRMFRTAVPTKVPRVNGVWKAPAGLERKP